MAYNLRQECRHTLIISNTCCCSTEAVGAQTLVSVTLCYIACLVLSHSVQANLTIVETS